MKIKYHVLFIIFLISLIISSIISFTPTPVICDPSDGCDAVLTSSYSSTFGIKNSIFGIFAFGALTIATLLQIKKQSNKKRNFIFLGIALGSLVALYFIYLQVFVLQAWCKYCMIVDAGLILALLIISIPRKKQETAKISFQNQE